MAELYLKHPPRSEGGEWPAPPSPEAISEWVGANQPLPEDYKAFLLKYNGGTVYPLEFDNNVDEDAADILDIEATTGVDILFDWDRFVEINGYSGKAWRQFMVAIGYDTTSSIIGLSILPENAGSVLYWWRNLPDAWEEDEDGPMPIGHVAEDFRDFLFQKLYASEGGGHPRWVLPQDLEKAQTVAL